MLERFPLLLEKIHAGEGLYKCDITETKLFKGQGLIKALPAASLGSISGVYGISDITRNWKQRNQSGDASQGYGSCPQLSSAVYLPDLHGAERR